MLVNNIINYIEQHDMSVSDFAKKCKLSTTTIFSIIKGQSENPTLEVLNKIAKATNMTLDELVKSEKKDIDEAKKLYQEMKALKDKEKKIVYDTMLSLIENLEKNRQE